MAYLSKYGVARKIRIPIVKRGVVDHAVSADWTPAAGDVKISKDGGAAANVTNLPTAIAMGNSTIWEFSLTATEMQAAQINVTVADAATKAVEDTAFDIETYGNASGQHAVDLADSVRAGLTALPNAAAEAAGGLYTRGSGAGQINQPANGQIDANTVKVGGTTQTARDLGANLDATVSSRLASASISLSGGAVTVGTNNDKTGYALSSGGVQAIWDALTSALTTANSIGKRLADDIDATISSRLASASISLSGGAVTVGTNNDKTGYGLSAAAVQAIWDALTSALTTVGSIGKRLVDYVTGDTYGRLGAPAGASVSADIASIKTDTGTTIPGRLPSALSGSGNIKADVEEWKGATAPAMTGDAYARLGAPAGASVSADVAAVKSDTSAIKTDVESVSTGLPVIAGYIDTEVAAIKAKTDNLPASPAAVSDIPTANQVADALLDRSNGIETGYTPRQSLRLMLAALVGKLSGAATTTVTIRNVPDTKDRITATVDANGNRTAVTTDVT